MKNLKKYEISYFFKLYLHQNNYDDIAFKTGFYL